MSGKNDNEISHFHHCPICSRDVPSYREATRCPDDKDRICGRCTAGLFNGRHDGR